MADNLDIQEPEKPRKKKSSGTISMPVFVGSLLGMGILVAVVVILVIQFVIKEPANGESDGENTEDVAEKGDKELSELDLEEMEFLESEKARKLIEFERITTNPMGSSKYAVISLSVSFLPHPELPPEEITPDSDFIKRVRTKTINIVSGELRKMDEVALKNITYEELQAAFKELLKEYYRRNKIFLREILITELIVQN